jgi:hypothetical protein
MHALEVRLARRLNRFFERRGKFFADRYHSARIDRLMDEFEDRMSRTETVEIGRDGHGRVAIEGLAPGEYTVCVSAPGEGSCGPTVQPSKRARAVRLRLAADGSIASWD